MIWNLWHGCHKVSEGCLHCYVFRKDKKYGIDTSIVHKTKNFNLPIIRRNDGKFKIPSDTTLWTCFTSDFFIEESDKWRDESWKMIKFRSDVKFIIVTKRVQKIQ